MAFDEVEFLTAIKTYLAANLSGISVYLVHTLNTSQLYNIRPPMILIKDGSVQNVMLNECSIRAEIEITAVSDLSDELGGRVVGRSPDTTWFGVSDMLMQCQTLLTTTQLADGLSMTNTQFKTAHWASMEPSEYVGDPDSGLQWQTKTLRLVCELRAL